MVVCAKFETVGRRYGKQGRFEEEVCARGPLPPARRIYYPFISNFYTQREGKVVRGGPFLFSPISHKKVREGEIM